MKVQQRRNIAAAVIVSVLTIATLWCILFLSHYPSP